MNRRFAILSLASLAIAAPAYADPYGAAMEQFELAKRNRDFATGERWIQEALRYGRGNEYAWRSLAWCQARQGKWRESLATAQQNVRRNGATAWSLLQLYESNMVAGNYQEAGSILQAGMRLRNLEGIDYQKTYNQYLLRTSIRTYDLTIELVPEGHRFRGPIKFLIPTNCERQEFINRTIDGGTESRFYTFDNKGFLEVKLVPGQRTLLKGTLILKPHFIDRAALEEATIEMHPRLLPYFKQFRHGATNTYDPNLPALLQIASQIKGESASEKVKSILLWLESNFRYEKLEKDDLPSIISARHGVCHHYCGLFSALSRALSVPARILHVTVIPDLRVGEQQSFNAPGEPTKAHGQNEVWMGAAGWIPLEPQRSQSFGNYTNSVILFGHAGNGPNDNFWQWRSVSICPMTIKLKSLSSGFDSN